MISLLTKWFLNKLALCSSRPYLLGIAGAQGCGKTTLAHNLAQILTRDHGFNALVLSLDDFYKTRGEREQMAKTLHPLFKTRGVPGTHDTELLLTTIKQIKSSAENASLKLAVFDKALDDRLPADKWRFFSGRPDVVLFEGWCVGARPEPKHNLTQPMSLFESEQDPQGVWRHLVNQMLAKDYQAIWKELHGLIFLQVPNWEVVFGMRLEQEQDLPANKRLTEEQLRQFIGHFQRLTCWMFEDMTSRANLVLKIDQARRLQHPFVQIK